MQGSTPIAAPFQTGIRHPIDLTSAGDVIESQSSDQGEGMEAFTVPCFG